MVKKIESNKVLCEAQGKTLEIVVKNEADVQAVIEIAEAEIDRCLYPEEEEISRSNHPNFYKRDWTDVVTDAIMGSWIDAEVYGE